jgi:hypothetical protein
MIPRLYIMCQYVLMCHISFDMDAPWHHTQVLESTIIHGMNTSQ